MQTPKYNRQMFDRYVADCAPEFLDKENFFLIVEFDGYEVKLKCRERLVTTTTAGSSRKAKAK